MQATAEEQRKNQEAESNAVRRQLWGAEETVEDDEMRTTVLGDITHPAPIIMPQQQNQLAPMLAGFAIAALSGIAVYYLLKKESPDPAPVDPVSFNDETVSVGLGRIEDYLTKDASP